MVVHSPIAPSFAGQYGATAVEVDPGDAEPGWDPGVLAGAPLPLNDIVGPFGITLLIVKGYKLRLEYLNKYLFVFLMHH
jgi:hypothetical protein